MNSTTTWHPSVDTALFMLIHSITPPPIASKTYYHRAPSTIFTPGRSLGSDPYPGGSYVYRHTSVGNAGILFPSWNAGMPGKATTWTAAGYGLSIDTLQNYQVSPGVLHRLEYKRPPQYELHPQSLIPGDLHHSDPATSSVTRPSVIRLPLWGTLRPLHGTHSQNVIPGVPYLSGPVASSVTHRPVIPGRFPPYLTLRLHPPSSQSRISFMSEHERNSDDETERKS